jgi:hypothetical protein
MPIAVASLPGLLRDGVDEDKVEEELEGGDPVFAFGLLIVHP